jgi:serine/threonine protein kinase
MEIAGAFVMSRNPLITSVAAPRTRQLDDSNCIDLGDGRRLILRDVIGKGTSASVSRALLGSGTGVAHAVAVKLFPAASSEESASICDALTRTAARTACIEHPNVVRTFDCGFWGSQPLLITELVNGVSLAELQELFVSRKKRLPLDLALFIAIEVAEALAAAQVAKDHDGEDLDILHHALSVREVLLSWQGEVKVSDFEMSVAYAATSSVRSLRGVASRVRSMAPEVAQGHAPNARSDVFSFGVLLRELLVGPRFPPAIGSTEAVHLAREGFIQPMTFQPRLPRELDSLMERALEIDPAARYPNASALAADLRPLALAMGASDGRYFLRKTLEREWESDDEVTAPTSIPDLDTLVGPR